MTWKCYSTIHKRATASHHRASKHMSQAIMAMLDELDESVRDDIGHVRVHFNSLGGHAFTITAYRGGDDEGLRT